MNPCYNTADAALLFINCVYLYFRKTRDAAFVEEMYPVMERIVKGYMQGTRFGIHMDTDGLIAAGQGLDQVTWMDVRVGEILPTPRHGKPVEINAYWYNALRIMEALGRKAKADGCGPGLRGSGGAGEAFLHGKVLGSRTGLSEGCASRDGCEKGFRGDGERPCTESDSLQPDLGGIPALHHAGSQEGTADRGNSF